MYKIQFGQWLLVACWLGLQTVKANESLLAFPPSLPSLPSAHLLTRDPSRPSQSSKCPADVKTLTSWLLKDLPSYANRVLRQARRLDRKNNGASYVVLAGNPEFEPLTLGPGQYNPPTSATDLEPPQQVFLTTLERQYITGKAIESQHYHWLFLTQTPEGWRLAMMFSQIGSSLPERAPTPPRESSNGVIGQAVTIWLRDCRAGGIRPPRVSGSGTSTEKG